MKARIGFVLFIFIFLVAVVGSLLHQAIMLTFNLLSRSWFILSERSKAWFSTLNWLKVRTSLAGWKNFMQRAS